MKKIMIIGPGGAGKSTLAREISKKLGLPVYHLDVYFWKPGWVESPDAEWQATQKQMIKNEQWIMDGNYEESLEIRLEACDTVIFLNFSRAICFYRVYKRYFQFKGKTRTDINEGCPERVALPFIQWIWHYPRRSAPEIIQKINTVSDKKNVFILKSPKAVKQFLENL